MNTIKKDSFVVISDFHSYEWPLDKVKNYYLNEYDKIYILGDATDRGENSDGTGGISLLQEIKKLCEKYPERVFYLPGNHDDFLYQYAKYKDSDAKNGLTYNQGTKTIEDIKKLKRKNPFEFKELIDWLGTQPLQREHFYNGQRYVFAHAFFNEDLFKENKLFSLKDYRKVCMDSYYYDILWFRKGESDYNSNVLPNGDTIMVIGHTPDSYRKGVNLDLVNSNGDSIKVHCVDGGIAYNGTMQKYTGGSSAVGTNKYIHKKPVFDVEEKDNTEIKKTTINNESIEEFVNMTFINYLQKYDTFERAMLEFLSASFSGNKEGTIINHDTNKEVSKTRVRAYLKEVLISYISCDKTKKEFNDEIINIFRLYFTKVAFDYIIKCQLKKFVLLNQVISQQEGLERTNDFFFITNSVGNARDIAKKVGLRNLNAWVENSEFTSFSEYIKKKFGKQLKK